MIINDTALARHIKQYVRANPRNQIVYGPTGNTDKTDIVGTGCLIIKTYLNQLPKTRAALAECGVQPAAADRIKTFAGLLCPHTSDFTVLTATNLILQHNHTKASLRLYRSKDHLWYLDTRLLDVFGGTPELTSQEPTTPCYISDTDSIAAIIMPVRPAKPSDRTQGPEADIRAALRGVAL